MRRLPTALAWVGLAAVVLLAYVNSFGAGLTLDNKFIVGADPRLRAWSVENLRLIFTENYWWPSTRGDLYRPLTTLSYAVNYTLLGSGTAVFTYHAVNFLLHAANVGLVFALVRRFSGSGFVAGVAALLFGVHPVNVEAVTNIVGRADLLAALAVLGAGWGYVQWTTSAERRPSWLVIAGTIAVLGVFAKENAIMVLGFVVLYDFVWRGPAGSTRSLRPAVGWIRQCAWPGWAAFLPAVVLLFSIRHALAAHLIPPGKAYVDDILYAATAGQRILTALGVLAREVRLLVYPATLSCDYSYAAIPLYGSGGSSADNVLAWIGAALAAAGVFAFFRWRVRAPLAAWSVGLFFLLWLPTSNLLFPTGSVMAERFLYLPSIGFCTLVAVGGARLLRIPCFAATAPEAGARIPRPAAQAGPGAPVSGRISPRVALGGLVPAAFVTALACRTHVRNRDWHDEFSLWQSAVMAVPASYKAHKGYAQALWERGRNEPALDQALRETEEARRIVEQLPLEQRDESLYLQLGMYWRFKSELSVARHEAEPAAQFRARAIAALAQAQKIDEIASARFVAAAHERLGPGAAIAAPGNAQIFLERAVCEQQAEDWPAVRQAALQVEHFAPAMADGYALAGVAEYRERRYDSAVVHFLAGLIVAPTDTELGQNLARAYRQLGFAAPPVGARNGSLAVASDSRRSEADLRAAFALLIRNHLNAGQIAAAEQLRAVARAQFGLVVGDTP